MDLLDGSNDAWIMGDGANAGPRERRHLSWIQSSAQEAPGSGASDDWKLPGGASDQVNGDLDVGLRGMAPRCGRLSG